MKTDRTSFAVVFFLTLVGLAVRISAPLSASFPLNDGGLFYTMILDIQTNHFVLPSITTYNNAALPFAYPPLAFYLYALISSLGHISVLKLMQFLPSIVSGLTIPAFYLLAREILESKAQVALALLAFAFVPRAFDWLIMGGGVTRSLGLLFALLAMRQAYRLFSKNSTDGLLSTLSMILLGGFVVYTHPEAATHTAISAIFFYFWNDRTIKGLVRAVIAGLAILLITAPWWVYVVTLHGIDPFLAVFSAARQNSYNALVGFLILFRFNFTDEPYLTLIAVIGLIGLFTLLATNRFFIPFWFFLMHIIEPRGGSLYMMIPLAMFAAIGLDQTILPALRGITMGKFQGLIKVTEDEAWAQNILDGRYVKIFLIILFIYTSLSAFQTASNINQQFTLTNADLEAFGWIKRNTSPDSQFALVTQGDPLNDASSEWFPALTERTSVATVFGYEWIKDGKFSGRVASYEKLQFCATQDVMCLNQWTQMSGREFSYVYIRKRHGSGIAQTSLNAYLSKSPDYKSVYDTLDVVIYLKK